MSQPIARWLLLTAAAAFSTVASGQASEPSAAPVRCMTGPSTKTIGGNAWLVYACSDGKSLAVVSTPSIAPNWFYYIVAPSGDGYAVSGEASGDKSVTRPVFEELSAMSPDAVAALYKEVQDSAAVAAPGVHPPDDTQERALDP